jgi:hypothetical protein
VHKHALGPFPSGYVPKLDTSAELNNKDASFYQLQISILHWCVVELGLIDIIMEVLTLSSHQTLQGQGHLDVLFHLFAYLKKKHNA